jgi:hypothetical protein
MSPALPTLKLYQIADDYLQALDALAARVDTDGSLPDAIHDALNQLEGTFEAKAVNVAAYIRSLEAEAQAIAAVKQSMERRIKSLEYQSFSLRSYLQGEMERTGLTRIAHPWLALRIQSNPPSVVIDNEGLVPDGFKETLTTVKILKADIGKALKAGEAVAGAHLEQTSRLVIT